MSNPHDDPGRRPPPPRQGEPHSSYQGGPPPPYQGDPHAYQGPPQQPGGPWQGPPPGHGGPQQPSTAPGYAPRKDKGFFGALFDLNFDHMVTTKLIKVSYVLAIVVYSLIALVMLIFVWSFSVWNKPLAFATFLATPIVWVSGLLSTRLVLEFAINQFKITEHLKAMREREGLR